MKAGHCFQLFWWNVKNPKTSHQSHELENISRVQSSSLCVLHFDLTKPLTTGENHASFIDLIEYKTSHRRKLKLHYRITQGTQVSFQESIGSIVFTILTSVSSLPHRNWFMSSYTSSIDGKLWNRSIDV